MDNKKQLRPETLCFVEALQALLQTEDSIYQGLTETYGEEGGEKVWYKSPAYNYLELAKREIKVLLGDSVELGLSGFLGDIKDKKEEAVC